VGYGTGPRKSAHEKAAQTWAVDHGYAGVLLWRRDGASLQQAPADQRHRLHQALFCVRAEFADGLWLASWDHLGDLTTRELVCAEIWANGGQVVVDGQVIDPEGAVPPEQQLLRDLATAGTRLREAAFPREAGSDDPDIGSWDSDWERTRLAYKLREDFQLTYQEIADFLNTAEYASARGRSFTPSNIQNLLTHHTQDLRPRGSDARLPGSAGVHGSILATYGPDAENLKSAADAYNATLSKRYKDVLAIPEHPAVIGDGAEGTGLDPTVRRLRTLVLLTAAEFVGGVYVSSADAFGSPIVRELIYAQLWQAGASVIVDGILVDPENRGDPVTAVLRPAARSGTRLHRALRAHDRNTIIDEGTTLRAAQVLAQTLRAQGRTLEWIARRLNDEAIPTRKRVGRWSASAVSQVLGSAPPADRVRSTECGSGSAAIEDRL
jgi:hypothetical protein